MKTVTIDDGRSGARFEFGKNWASFLDVLNEERIRWAEESLAGSLGNRDLKGKTFLDAGSGSGLFSLAARKMGARVYSFDYDPQSVACTAELKRRYFCDDPDWTVRQGSVLDAAYLESIGEFDIVYSWGVLHHTGDLWNAMNLITGNVAPGGILFVAIYNDQGAWSRVWKEIKKTYNRLPRFLQGPFAIAILGPREVKSAAFALLKLRPRAYFRLWTEPNPRGMNRRHDLIDWVGGYPFDVAKPLEVQEFYSHRGYSLKNLKTCGGGSGCNEFVFQKIATLT